MQLEQIQAVFKHHSTVVWPGRSIVTNIDTGLVMQIVADDGMRHGRRVRPLLVVVSAFTDRAGRVCPLVDIAEHVDLTSEPGGMVTERALPINDSEIVTKLGGVLVQVGNMLDQIQALEAG
jgi:hypothetical protein